MTSRAVKPIRVPVRNRPAGRGFSHKATKARRGEAGPSWRRFSTATPPYVLKDYLDPVALIDTAGNVTERYRYDAFGTASILAPDFTPRAASECDWTFLYHAEFIDPATGLYNYGYRFYHPGLGRWLSRDPIEEDGGVNLYGFVENNTLSNFDLNGLLSKSWSSPADDPGELSNGVPYETAVIKIVSAVDATKCKESQVPYRDEKILS